MLKTSLLRLKRDLELIIQKSKPMKGIGTLKDNLKPFDRSGIDPKEVVILNHRDMDGYLSAISVNLFFNGDTTMKDVQYNEPIDFDELKDKVVFIVDFSLPAADMVKVSKTAKKLYWIDHHIGAINKLKEELSYNDLKNIDGICCDGPSGCELTWMYLNGGIKDIPATILIAGAYDTFRYNGEDTTERVIKKDLKFHEDFIMPMHYGFSKEFTNQSDISLQLLTKSGGSLDSLYSDGKAIYQYKKKMANESVRVNAFLVELEGIKLATMFNNCRGSAEFGDVVKESNAEAMLAIMPNDKGAYLSFYCDSGLPMNKVAESFGGGGHVEAAGAFVNKKILSSIHNKAQPLVFKV